MAASSALEIDDVVVSKVQDGHLLLIVTADPADRLSLVYRGHGWNVQYAVARGARLASGRGGNLWYTSDETATLEYLDTFPRDASELKHGRPAARAPCVAIPEIPRRLNAWRRCAIVHSPRTVRGV